MRLLLSVILVLLIDTALSNMPYESDSWWVTGWEWNKKFIIFPHRSEYSNKWLWLESVYYGKKIVLGPGSPVQLERYLTPEEYIWHQLTS